MPRRALPHDVVLFAPDAPARLAAGHELIIGSSSPRRASFVPQLLQQLLPYGARVRLVELRGNVDSRLRRLHEPRGSARQLDGVVLAFAGIARLWADEGARKLVAPLLRALPRMVLPLSACPPAPAQGALGIECRREDTATAALLAGLDHAATRRAVQVERQLLAQRGGGCQQRFGAVQTEVPGLGTLLYWREAHERAGVLELDATQVQWTPASSLPPVTVPLRPWDGCRAAPPAVLPLPTGVAAAAARLDSAEALFIAHRRALPEGDTLHVRPSTRVWVPGIETWRALAQRDLWVEGCAEGLGMSALAPLLEEPWLQLPSQQAWTVLTHRAAVAGWPAGTATATYEHDVADAPAQQGPPADATHVYWSSTVQFERWHGRLDERVQHACGPGKTFEHLRRAGVQNLHMFPQVQQWREWLQS